MAGLGDLEGGGVVFDSFASDVSVEGVVVVGTGNDSNSWRWTQSEGMVDLGNLPGGSNGRAHVAAFVMDQETPRNANYCLDGRHVTVEEVEERTGLDLFPRFAGQTVIERRLSPEVGCPEG